MTAGLNVLLARIEFSRESDVGKTVFTPWADEGTISVSLSGITYLAHSRNGNRAGIVETMPQHVLPVCKRAVSMAEELGLADDARLAAILHDLGKYSKRFLARLEGKERGLDHSSAGARAALEHSGAEARPVALAIEGHHVGMPRGSGTLDAHRQSLDHQLAEDSSTGTDWRGMVRLSRAEGIAPCHPTEFESRMTWSPGSGRDDAAEMLDVRMLLSTLVDADYIETEAHFEGDATVHRRPRDPGPVLDAAAGLDVVLAAADERRRTAKAAPRLLELRDSLRTACLAAAGKPVGLFTLTAPTGAGKTLAMLAFALAHAATHRHIRRIVMVIPFLTIIDQTAKICRDLFGGLGPLFVLEDHSAACSRTAAKDNEHATVRQQRLLAENFDAPIVLTTSLNALESLHANDPRRCRKLHHLANSVLLFDEVQTLPPHLAELTLATLGRVSDRFKTTVVFSTATQPPFDVLDGKGSVSKLCTTGWRPDEIVPDVAKLFALADDRYVVTWRLSEPTAWDAIAGELREYARHGPVIAIVNLKRHAIRLADAVRTGKPECPIFHLSTNLCPRHRERVLNDMRPFLDTGRPMILVATQCIEAGVDISAPVVYRAVAPLESIAQAAGRCNRHGTDPEAGRVVVFLPEDEGYPPGAYETAAQHTKAFLAQLRHDGVDPDHHNVLADPKLLRLYYRQLYQAGIQETVKRKDLLRATEERDFPEVSRLYRLIDQDSIEVIVPYDRKAFRRLIRDVEKDGRITRDWVAEARPLAVNLRRPPPDDMVWASLRPLPAGTPEHEADWFAPAEQATDTLYDSKLLGLVELRRNWFTEPV